MMSFMSLVAGVAVTMMLVTQPSLAEAHKMRVGVEGNYPPFSMIGPDGKLSGFDIDIANALCAEMKTDCTLVQQEWDGMIPALNTRKFDMVVASMTITAERSRIVDFSDVYYDVPSRWIAKQGSFDQPTPDALKGKVIIVLRNSPRAKHVKEKYPESKTLLVAKEPDVYLELRAGRGDIAFGSSVMSEDIFLKRPEGAGFTTVGEPVRLKGDSDVGIAVRKGDTPLRDRINTALKNIKADGRYQQIANKYFSFDVSGG